MQELASRYKELDPIQVKTLLQGRSTPPIVLLHESSIYYYGAMARDGVARVAELLESRTDLRKLVINSWGGDSDAGLQLGRIISEKSLVFEVQGFCMSACSSFPLRSAKQVILNGVIGFHGSSLGCLQREGHIGLLRKIGIPGYVSFLGGGYREKSFNSQNKRLSALIEMSAGPTRGDPTGKANEWEIACPKLLKAQGLPIVSQALF